MTPIELSNLYQTLRNRVSIHCPNSCAEISLPLPSNFGDELEFCRLVIWGYALFYEAAKIPLEFLANLPPLMVTDNSLRNEISALRTYMVHNLDLSEKRDQKTYAIVHRWFKEACGRGTPENAAHYAACCEYFVGRLQKRLNGAIEACDLFDNPEDGPRLVADLKGRIDLVWKAHQFDPIVANCAARLGNPGINLRAICLRNLERWRDVLKQADEKERERVLEQRIEADLLQAIGDALPQIIRENLQRVAASTDATVAALLLLREAQRIGTMTLQEIIELVSSQTLNQGTAETGAESVDDRI